MSLDVKAVRAWGVANGHCTVTGKLPQHVVESYLRANGRADEVEPQAEEAATVDEWDAYVDQCVKQLVDAITERSEIRIRAQLLRVIGGE